MARAIGLINSLQYGKNENIPNIDRQFADNSPKKIFFTKLVQNHFPKFAKKFSENPPRIIRKNCSRVLSKPFLEFYMDNSGGVKEKKIQLRFIDIMRFVAVV